MTRRLLAIGECMVELSPAPDGLFAMKFAGDTFNTAWYARKLGGASLRVGYLSAVGDDAISDRMADFMHAAGIEPELARHAGASVGLYMISLHNGERSFSYWRDSSAARRLADDLGALDGLRPGDLAFFSGITLAILPADGRERLLAALAVARARGVQVAFDSNLRPRLWRDTDEMCGWVMRAAAVADISLPSYDDEAAFFGDADKTATAQRYRDAGAGTVIVKDGPGAVLILTEHAAPDSVAPTPVTPVDTTAAGDSFNAGFFVALLAGSGMAAAVRAGCAVSAQVVTRRGALVDIAV